VSELHGVLADGPKSRSELAGALGVSPARVQQLLAELGGAVSSRPHPEQRQGKLWSLTGAKQAAR
jgi:DNA-binding MarR family transcriptional regulator